MYKLHVHYMCIKDGFETENGFQTIKNKIWISEIIMQWSSVLTNDTNLCFQRV